MAICKKGFTMETKTCNINCSKCTNYEALSKKERQAKANKEHKEFVAKYIKTANPKSCQECKLYNPEDYEKGGWTICARCDGLNKSFEPLKHGQTHKKLVGCPFKEDNK